MKSTSGLIRRLNACKGHIYLKLSHKPPRHKSHNEEDTLSGNWEDEGDLFRKTVSNVTANSTPETPTEKTPRKELFASKSLSALKKEWFSSHEFPAGTPISDKKYKHPGSKHKNSFYPFNDQLDYGLAHYFRSRKLPRPM